MSAHLEMNEPARRHRLDEMVQGVIGEPMARPEGPLKVSGTATYAHEFDVPDKAFGVLVRAPFAKGTVTGLGLDAAKAMPGVLAVIDDARLLRNPAQGGADEAPVQSATRVDYFGQAIALVVADTFERARHAAQALEVSFDAADDGCYGPEQDGVTLDVPEKKQYEQGDLEAAMRSAAHTIDETYRTPGHTSAAMEPHASIASWEGDALTLHGSYQMLLHNRKEIADALGIEPDDVRIVANYVGGGFGSKLGIAPEAVAAAIAARQLGRPVSVTLGRRQVVENTMRRSETRQRVRLAADGDGVLTGIGHDNLVSQLPGESFAEPVSQAIHFMYGGEHRHIALQVARVNRTCAGSVRAPGESVGVSVFEIAMDELAQAAGIDPVELRKRNIPELDPEKHIPNSSRRFAEALDEGARRFGWKSRGGARAPKRDGDWLVGTGMAGAARVHMIAESKARVRLEADGTATIETDMTDVGTGSYAILTQIAAEMLGLDPSRVTARLGDSRYPASSGSGGSWGAASSGSSVFLACEELRRRLAERLGCEPSELALKDGEAIGANRRVPLAELLAGDSLEAEGHIEPGDTADDARQASYGAHFAEVGVNIVTGETRVRRMTGVFGAGRILNARTARSQCQGGMIWGIGMALTEELMHDARDGRIVNNDLAEYHVPVNLDVPQIEVHLLEERDEHASPIQAKGIGELGICGAAGAIVNAIFDATGVRVRSLPVTLDKLLPHLPDL